jgi:Phage Tail Collar Domain
MKRSVLAARLALAFALTLALTGASPAVAVPQTIGYQGRLYDAKDAPINATLSVAFALYAAASGGTAVWTETQSVTFTNGYFAVQLGAVTPLGGAFDGTTRYLGVAVGTDPEMTPRAAVASVPYALAAGSAPPDGRFGTDTSLAAAGAGATCTLGAVWLTAGTVAGGTPAAGQLLPISQNVVLFALLGTTYGGDGKTTFALPDLRGAAPNGLTYVICATSGVFPARN